MKNKQSYFYFFLFSVFTSLSIGSTGICTVKKLAYDNIVKVSPASKKITLKEKKTKKIKVSIKYKPRSFVSYRSNNKKVATVNKSGTIAAKKSGKATITVVVAYNKYISSQIIPTHKVYKYTVTVKGKKKAVKKVQKKTIKNSTKKKETKAKKETPFSVSLSDSKVNIEKDSAAVLSIKGISSSYIKKTTWSSKDKSIASVSKGKISGHKKGTTVVKAKITYYTTKAKTKVATKTYSCSVNVKEKEIIEKVDPPKDIEIHYGQKLSDIPLVDGCITIGEEQFEGGFSWVSGNTLLNKGTHKTKVYRVLNGKKYICDISVNVLSTMPVKNNVSFKDVFMEGRYLSSYPDFSKSFSFVNPYTKANIPGEVKPCDCLLKEGITRIEYTFAPQDQINYENVSSSVVLQVQSRYDLERDGIYTEPIPEQVYTGNPIVPSVKIYTDSSKTKELQLGEDYEKEYSDNINAGTGYICIKGKKDFKGEVKIPFTITPVSISTTRICLERIGATYVYTGKRIEPVISGVYFGDTQLKEGRDYSYEYKDNLNAGLGNICFYGYGNFSGEHILQFQIKRASLDDADIILSQEEYEETGDEITPLPVLQIGNRVLKLDEDYELFYENNISPGVAIIVISGKGNYSKIVKIRFTIQAKEMKSSTGITNEPIKQADSLEENDDKQTVQLKVKKNTKNVILKWKKIKKTKTYIIYQKKGKKYKRIGSSKKCKFTVKNLVKGKTYSFKIKGYKKTVRMKKRVV